MLRMAIVCFTSPMFGYANNFDFYRQSACVGVWVDYKDRPRYSLDKDRPMDGLVFDGQRYAGSCLHASDNLFPWLVARLHHKHDRFSVRQVGAARAVVVSLFMILILAQPMMVGAHLALALCYLLVFGDLSIMGYLNTLYVDASGIAASTLAASMIVAMGASRRAPSWGFCALSAVLLGWLGATKPQYLPLSCVFGVLLALPVWRHWRRPARAALLALAGLAGPLLFVVLNAGGDNPADSMRIGNKQDTVMAAVLPAAPDKARALRLLGLPASCAGDIGKNGYQVLVAKRTDCPELATLSRVWLLPLFIVEPATFVVPLWRALRASQTTIEVLPHYERPADRDRLRFRLLSATSVSTWLGALPAFFFAALMIGMTGLGLAALPVWVWATARQDGLARWRAPLALLAMGGTMSIYAMGSAVFGDGYVELSRHEALVIAGLVFSVVGLVCAALGSRLKEQDWG
jgi:hypothetical protein